MRGDIAVDFSGRPDVRTSGRPSVPFWLKFFCLLISRLVFIGLLFIFYIQLPKDLGNIFPRYFFLKKIFFYCKFRRFRLRIFYKILVFWDYWLKFLKVLVTSKCVTGLLFNFRKTFFISFATVSQPFSEKIVICNSQFTHFSTDGTLKFLLLFSYYYFQIEVFGWSFCKCL